MRMRIFQPHYYVSVAVLRVGYAEVVFHSTRQKVRHHVTWCLAKTSYPTSRWVVAITKLMITAAGRRSLSHRQKHRNLQLENLQFTEPNIFPPNSSDLNTVNLPSEVLFSRRFTIIKVSPQLTTWRERLSKSWQKLLPHGAVIAIHHFYNFFYLRLMLFARRRHHYPRLIQINYCLIFRMYIPWFVPSLVKICSIFLKL